MRSAPIASCAGAGVPGGIVGKRLIGHSATTWNLAATASCKNDSTVEGRISHGCWDAISPVASILGTQSGPTLIRGITLWHCCPRDRVLITSALMEVEFTAAGHLFIKPPWRCPQASIIGFRTA